MSTHRGSGSGSGTAPASGMAGTSEGIALGESVALAEGMAEGVGIVSAEDIAEGIGSSRSPALKRTRSVFQVERNKTGHKRAVMIAAAEHYWGFQSQV
jgi:hypothetical protein